MFNIYKCPRYLRKSYSMASRPVEESTYIREAYSGRCRIVDVVGSINGVTKSITLQPKNMDLTIKFQLHETYPTTTPIISIKSASVDTEEISDLTEILNKKATFLIKQPMILQLMESAEAWLKENGLGHGSEPKKGNPKQRKKNGKKKTIADEIDSDVKQPPMKTATDVIKRIQWDSDLPQEDFLVGYIDRFIGIQEKYFTAFSWEDIATVDYNVLAIPKHRIQYFKYKNVKVWDKSLKLDNVFGSLGSNKTIINIIDNYDKELEKEPKENLQEKTPVAENQSSEHENQDDNDSDSDDGVVVSFDSAAINTATRSLYLDHGKRPTHFISIRIDNEDTVKNMTQVQSFITDQKPQLKTSCMPPCCFHVTLCTLGLDRDDQIREACDVLRNCQSELLKIKPSEPLTFTGVDNFYNRTIFAKIKYPRAFLDFVDFLKHCFTSAGIDIRDSYGFVPHSTLLKISKQEARELGAGHLVSYLYHNHKDSLLGSQSLNKISLCCMGEQRQEDGFWTTLQDIQLTS